MILEEPSGPRPKHCQGKEPPPGPPSGHLCMGAWGASGCEWNRAARFFLVFMIWLEQGLDLCRKFPGQACNRPSPAVENKVS